MPIVTTTKLLKCKIKFVNKKKQFQTENALDFRIDCDLKKQNINKCVLKQCRIEKKSWYFFLVFEVLLPDHKRISLTQWNEHFHTFCSFLMILRCI